MDPQDDATVPMLSEKRSEHDADQTIVMASPACEANSLETEATVDPEATSLMDSDGTQIMDIASSLDDATEVQSSAATSSAGMQSRRPDSLGVGSVLRGRFRIEKVLGEGGMGSVFSAVDLLKQEALDKDIHVALKVMKPGLADPELTFMGLQREARRAQQLAHPNIVTVFDFDRADGHIYMTMEHLRGQAIGDLLKANPKGLKPELARDITRQVASGLAYAHEEGIVHVDLKPQNIFMLDSGRVKILDFGIAKAYQEQLSDVVDDAFSGYSPPYASPQLIRQERPTPRDDVFALGIVTYALFTGKHPFDWKRADVVEATGLRPNPSPAFRRSEWRAVRAALNVDAARRPADAAAFLKLFAPSRIKRVAMAVSSASVISALAFILLYRPEAGPEIPFEQLDPGLQSRIQVQLVDASSFAEFGDLDSALQLYQAVLEMHPGNLEATRGMNETVDLAIERIRQLQRQGGITAAGSRTSLEGLLSYSALPARARQRIEEALDSSR